ncbi:MAG: transcription termination factor NusA [Lentisphaeria bacterium]
MNNELLHVLDYLEHERGIDRETLQSLIEESLKSAAKKAVHQYDNVNVKFDLKTGAIQCWATMLVVDVVENPGIEIDLSTAAEQKPEIKIGDMFDLEVTPEDFGRIAAQTARQVITQRLRQAEKRNICDSFKDQFNQLISGIIKRVDRGEVVIDFGQAEGVMVNSEKIPGEEYFIGDHIMALLIEINADRPGPSLYVSRSHPDLVVRLFEREVTEINNGQIEIKSVAREPGYRSKIAVYSTQPRLDPVGACVGQRGNRVKTIVRELSGEKVDIVNWDPDIKNFVVNALKPAKLASIVVNEKKNTIFVKVSEDQLSLSIGKRGQNARLASRLTGWRIDISKAEVIEEEKSDDFAEKVARAVKTIGAVEEIGEETAKILVHNGFASLEGIVAGDVSDIAVLEGIGPERAAAIQHSAKVALS